MSERDSVYVELLETKAAVVNELGGLGTATDCVGPFDSSFGTLRKAGPHHKCDQYQVRHVGVAGLCVGGGQVARSTQNVSSGSGFSSAAQQFESKNAVERTRCETRFIRNVAIRRCPEAIGPHH